MDVQLEPEQAELLTQVVEAHRRVPRAQRDRFWVLDTNEGTFVLHRGLGDWQISAVYSDLEILASYGLLHLDYGRRGRISGFAVRPEAIATYENLKKAAGAPIAQVEADVLHYLDAERFSARNPGAYEKWRQAAEPLWGEESQQVLTAIGHHCREALQQFATALVERYKPPNVDTNPQHDVARVRAVLELAKSKVGDTEQTFLTALLSYWRAVTDLAQRQEHGGQREGVALTSEDARRVVFQTAIVMYEVDRSMESVLG